MRVFRPVDAEFWLGRVLVLGVVGVAEFLVHAPGAGTHTLTFSENPVRFKVALALLRFRSRVGNDGL